MQKYYIYKARPLMVLFLPKVYTKDYQYDLTSMIALDQSPHYTILNQEEVWTIVEYNDAKQFTPGLIRCILAANQYDCGLIFIWDNYGLNEIHQAMILTWYGIPGYDYIKNEHNILAPLKLVMDAYLGKTAETYGVHFMNDTNLYNNWNPDIYNWSERSDKPNFKVDKIISND